MFSEPQTQEIYGQAINIKNYSVSVLYFCDFIFTLILTVTPVQLQGRGGWPRWRAGGSGELSRRAGVGRVTSYSAAAAGGGCTLAGTGRPVTAVERVSGVGRGRTQLNREVEAI